MGQRRRGPRRDTPWRSRRGSASLSAPPQPPQRRVHLRPRSLPSEPDVPHPHASPGRRSSLSRYGGQTVARVVAGHVGTRRESLGTGAAR